MDIIQFKKDFNQSGLTQKAYGEQVGMSSSMVHYYLRKASESESTPKNTFQELSITTSSSGREIKILTSSGVEISIPI